MGREEFRLEGFRRALEEAGATLQEPTNEWELIRYRLRGRFSNVYATAKGKVTLCNAAPDHYERFRTGDPIVPSAAEVRTGSLVLYTDASSYHLTKVGAWAAILVDGHGKATEASGELKGEIHSSTSAEMRAAANGLWHFLKLGLIERGSAVRIISDNRTVVNRANGVSKHKKQDVKAAAIYLTGLAEKHGVKLSGEWIKGHQHKDAAATDRRVFYNRRCDELAALHSKPLHKERKAAAWARADAIREANGTDAHPEPESESVCDGN